MVLQETRQWMIETKKTILIELLSSNEIPCLEDYRGKLDFYQTEDSKWNVCLKNQKRKSKTEDG